MTIFYMFAHYRRSGFRIPAAVRRAIHVYRNGF